LPEREEFVVDFHQHCRAKSAKTVFERKMKNKLSVISASSVPLNANRKNNNCFKPVVSNTPNCGPIFQINFNTRLLIVFISQTKHATSALMFKDKTLLCPSTILPTEKWSNGAKRVE